MPKQRPPFDADRYQTLKAQGLSQRLIAQDMGIPESTLRDNLKVLQKALASQGLPQADQGLPEEDQGSPEGIPKGDSGIRQPHVSLGTPQPDQAETVALSGHDTPTLPQGGPVDTNGGPHQGTPESHQGTPPLYVHPGVPDDGEETPVGSEDIEGVHAGIPAIPSPEMGERHQGVSSEALSPQLTEALTAAWPDLACMVEWWRQRQQSAQEPPEKLERVTYHVAPTWIEAVRREADLTGESYAAVVNRAFAAYFGGKST